MYLLEAPKEQQSEEAAKFSVFAEACRILEEEGIPFVMGGGVAVRAYGRMRYLKDADLFMDKEVVFKAMDALTRHGAFHTRDTDATWLYKAIKAEVLVDLIVRTTGNIHMTPQAYARARRVTLYGYPFQMMGPEDLLFRKIHSHREGRPDQFDALSMLEQPIEDFDWAYFLGLAGIQCVHKVLGFLLWAQSELPAERVPSWVLRTLMDQVLSQSSAPVTSGASALSEA